MNAFVTKRTSGACGTEYVHCCAAGCVGLKSAARVTGWGSGAGCSFLTNVADIEAFRDAVEDVPDE